MKSRRNVEERAKSKVPGWAIGLGLVAVVALGVILIASNSSSAPTGSSEVKGAPSLKVDQEKIDLGNVKLGQTVQVSFEVTNVGEAPLRFKEKPYIEVKEGC